MTGKSLSEIRRKLSQLKHELAEPQQPDTAQPMISVKEAQPDSFFDVGLFLLAYLFWLLVITNGLLAFGIAITKYNCLYAVPAAWLTLWLTRSKKPLHALLITLIATAIILLCAYAISFVYDFSWDGNWYHKVDAGLLAWGWNPFEQSMGDYAFQSGIITPKTEWQVWFDGYPKGTYTIGACFYALFGTIEAGKCFNVIGMIALLCVSTTLIRKIGKLKNWQAFLIAFLLAVNPVSLLKAGSYYNDGFMGAMLTIFALSLYYLYLNERGELSVHCWILIFLSLSLGLNTKFSGLIFFGMLGIQFYLLWMITHTLKHGMKNSGSFFTHVTLLFFAAVVCAVCLAGATTYIVNFLRYQNPLYSVIGQDATPLADQEMPVYLRQYPQIVQFFYSIFSRATNEIFEATGNYFKLPFTISPEEWAYAANVDTRTSGWGILFSAAFVLSVFVNIAALLKIGPDKEKRGHFYFLLLIFAYLFIPPFFIAGVWWARYYTQLYWLPAIALGLLFSAGNHVKQTDKRFKTAGLTLLSVMIIGVMLFNFIPGFSYYKNQITATKHTKDTLNEMKLLHKVYTYRLTFYKNDFYGFLFNIIDYEIDYSFAQEQDANEVAFTNTLYSYVTYDAVSNADGKAQTTSGFLEALENGYPNICILIAAQDDASQALDEQTMQAMRALGLTFDLEGKYRYSYLAVLESGAVIYEQASADRLDYTRRLGSRTFTLVSGGNYSGIKAKIMIDGTNFALNRRGLNIIVYDKAADEVLDIAAIDSYLDLSLSR